MRVCPSLRRLAPMNDEALTAGLKMREHQSPSADGGAPNETATPNGRTARQSIRGRQRTKASHERPATARRAKPNANPSCLPSGDPSTSAHLPIDAPSANGAAERAIKESQPGPRAPAPDFSDGQPFYEHHGDIAAAGQANDLAEPTELVPAQPNCDDQPGGETQIARVVAGDDQSANAIQPDHVIATIVELWRRRQAWHRAEKSLTLQASALCRRYVGGDKDEAAKLLSQIEKFECAEEAAIMATLPLLAARNEIAVQRLALEKQLEKLAKSLPVAAWKVRGFGALSLAGLVGECGDIGSYKTVSAVWKRMGLAVIGEERQRRVAGDAALEHGYSPKRRAVAWNIGVSLMRAQRAGDSYRDFYDAEKEKQLAKGLTKGHAHNRACRHMTKRFLAELYGAWRAA